MYKNILFADDLSSRTQIALEEAIDLAKYHNAKLIILNVREDFLNKDEMVMLRVDVSDFQDDLKRKALAIKNKIELDVDDYGGLDLKYQIILREGKPSDVICKVADEHDIDLIIVGTHGVSSLKDAIFGSTAHSVINHSKRSVLTVWTKD